MNEDRAEGGPQAGYRHLHRVLARPPGQRLQQFGAGQHPDRGDTASARRIAIWAGGSGLSYAVDHGGVAAQGQLRAGDLEGPAAPGSSSSMSARASAPRRARLGASTGTPCLGSVAWVTGPTQPASTSDFRAAQHRVAARNPRPEAGR